MDQPPPKVTTRLGAVMAPRPDDRREPPEESHDDPPPFVGAPEPTVGEMFLALSAQMHEVATTSREARDSTSALRREVVPQIMALNRKVFGSKAPPPPKSPPPPPSSSASVPPGEVMIPIYSAPPLTAAVAEHASALGSMRDEVSSLRSEVDVLRSMNAQQSKTMGLAPPVATPEGVVKEASTGRKVSAYVGSRAFFKDLLLVIAALAGLVTTIRGAPSAAVAAPPVPYLSAPAGSR